MNTHAKTILVSVAVIAVALATAGIAVTYAMDSHSEQTTVTVSAADIQLDATMGDITLGSAGYPDKTVSDPSFGFVTFPSGSGTMVVKEPTAETYPGLYVREMTLTDLIPGDSVELTFEDISLYTTIDADYSCSWTIESEEDSALPQPYVVIMTVGGQTYTGPYEIDGIPGSQEPYGMENVTFLITLPENIGIEYSGASYTMTITLTAVQV